MNVLLYGAKTWQLRQEVSNGQVTRVTLAPEIAPDRDDVDADLLLT